VSAAEKGTLGSDFRKGVGMAVGIERSTRLGLRSPFGPDSIVLCSFGDASVNHATAQGAFNAAAWAAFQKLPVPILFVCEDNGMGVSVRTPPEWIQRRMSSMPSISYRFVDSTDLAAVWDVSQEAVATCREKRAPVFLHL